MQRPALPFRGNNVFFYYADLDRATDFYRQTLGFHLMADYGAARIFQLAASSFLTLVDSTIGMHSTDEAKTVTLACVVPEVERWYAYLHERAVPIHRELNVQPGRSHDSFVVLDPEGYFLEFERFNPHSENDTLLPLLDALPPTLPVLPDETDRPHDLAVVATVLWLYYEDIDAARRFMQETLGLTRVCDQDNATIFAASTSGFVGPVIAGQGLHEYSKEKAVTVSLLTDEIESWYAYLQERPDVRLRSEEVVTRERYRAFVYYAPANYYFEMNTFLDHPDNETFLQVLYPQSG